ncbi:MAG: SpoIIE family protein phosphatase, partial [Solirubrobacterales bacterium]|nr:SpoIIE family protein phosphatase [Solirubrobacterales bacterium]
VVHLRRDGDEVLLVAEPDAGRRDRLVEQVLRLNDDLIRSQRDLGRRQREVTRAQGAAEDAGRRVAQLEAVALAGFTTRSLDEALQRLLDLARAALASERAAVLLLEEGGRTLTTRAALGMDDTAFMTIGLGEGLAARVTGPGQRGLVIDDIARADVRTPFLRRHGGSVIVVPLRLDGDVIGLLYVSTAEVGKYADEDLRLLEAVGERAALAIGHAQLRDRERRIAETLQRSLLPQALPEVPGLGLAARYLPRGEAGTVGGDFYDAFVRPDGHVVLAIGDVAGKGLRAASTMGQVRAALHAYALEHADPAAILDRLDRFVAAADDMATAQVLVLDPATGAMRYAGAGHPPAVVGGRLLDGGASPPLGVGRDGRTSASTVLEAGDRAVLYTDGLVERRTEALDVSLRSLAAVCAGEDASLDALCDRVLGALLPGTGVWPDDVAMLTAERT